jgi:NADH-quinone oxidoreductase subunit F
VVVNSLANRSPLFQILWSRLFDSWFDGPHRIEESVPRHTAKGIEDDLGSSPALAELVDHSLARRFSATLGVRVLVSHCCDWTIVPKVARGAKTADMAQRRVVVPEQPIRSIEDYIAAGGGEGLSRAREIGPAQTIQEISLSRLRGRGGGGFPTGRKWAGVRDGGDGPRFAVCNAAEGEPATFKDRTILRQNPYQVIEGLAIAAFAVGANDAYIATKGHFTEEISRIEAAVTELSETGVLGDLTVSVVGGPDEYLFGEEKALLEVVEGRDPLPRMLPPFQHGLFAGPQIGWQATDVRAGAGGLDAPNPTAVNNVETLANASHVMAQGAEWFRAMGTDRSPGTIVCTVVGDVQRPLVVELEMGTPLSELIDMAGGPLPGRTLQALFSGVANPVLTPDALGTPLTYEDMTSAGSGLGAAGFAVYDDTACMVEVARAFSRFLYVESCGQCRSCKFGCGEVTRRLDEVVAGTADENDIEVIGERLRTVNSDVRCFLATEEQLVISSILTRFANEFALHLEGRCSLAVERPILVPKIVNLDDGRVTYDERLPYKQPDWTYSD